MRDESITKSVEDFWIFAMSLYLKTDLAALKSSYHSQLTWVNRVFSNPKYLKQGAELIGVEIRFEMCIIQNYTDISGLVQRKQLQKCVHT